MPRAAGRINLEELQPGQELNGLVTSVCDFGCFVDVGSDRDGFVHISLISENYVDDVANFVRLGQTVKVYMKELDDEGKLYLSMVKAKVELGHQEADLAPFVGFNPEEWMEGTVVSVADFGVFVLLPPPGGGAPVQGLVHVSQIRNGFVEHPAEEVEVGQVVKVRITDVIPEKGNLRLSMKPYTGPKAFSSPHSQDVSGFSDVAPSTWLKGRVHHTAPFGVFVEVEPPAGGNAILGLVHVTEIREGFVDDPAKEVEVEQEVSVRVVSANTNSGRLSLSMKPFVDGAA